MGSVNAMTMPLRTKTPHIQTWMHLQSHRLQRDRLTLEGNFCDRKFDWQKWIKMVQLGLGSFDVTISELHILGVRFHGFRKV